MILKDIIEYIDNRIPKDFGLEDDNIGFQGEYDLNQEIDSIYILMDLYREDDLRFSEENILIVTHHPPLFTPKTPTYTIHSNWDIIDGGANESLANILGLDIVDVFDKKTGIGRVCKFNGDFKSFKSTVSSIFSNVRIVNQVEDNKQVNNIGVISGFGLKNPEYIKLASDLDLDILISGDLTQETAVLASYLDITLIDLGHHDSEVPGLYDLKNILSKLNIPIVVLNKKPWVDLS
ncbi:MAG: Nif3-like dinuclear metal center hexameric protein [Methanobrevibacter boviskoreani]|jgi:dinuclear metal center YbgI/SA1388 family protein|uniref:Nif3-like dinuclear metal center hexameric protein n=2 Tax=Methanobrevibacter boviskoreani TaxID=1348249 RepID=UPI0023A7B8B2|nr:Nif3-like dinuclear metal center hexameric protein [Methanobrevibacter boviskoreani]MCI6775348.1 Nif3-like dinuclear metal center hexameric protein [Methanobrevibacter boviskoreani]MDD6257233.1 Nif3-like dinuclear metal center hexameric protein [Methanobrevibacter boviskoreani]MDY5614393.1 Nif3-like dinuclear metal center hexameric protein [Methanobrevibacter boviskoreani]